MSISQMFVGLHWVRCCCAALVLFFSVGLHAQEYPSRAVRLVAPFSAGGGADALARILAKRLSDILGQPVYVENRGGASGVIGTDLVAKAAPDGYTLGFVMSAHVINAATRKKLPYDPVQSFTPVSLFASAPLILAVTPSFPADSVQALLAAARSKPGQIDYASTGPASVPHLAGEMLKRYAKVDLRHISYKGVSGALTDVMAGIVPVTFQGAATVLPLVKSGKLRALAVTSAKRLPSLPDLPTLQEAGVDGYDMTVWYGVLAPNGTPPDIVAKLNAAVQRVQRDESLVKALAELSATVVLTTPAQFRQFLVIETERYSQLVRSMGGVNLE